MMKNNLKILIEAIIIAMISFGISCFLFWIQIKAEIMYDQTLSDAWGIVMVVMIYALGHSNVITSIVYWYVCKRKKRLTTIRFKIMLIISAIIYIGLILFVLPISPLFHYYDEIYVPRSEITSAEWMVLLIDVLVLSISGVWIIILILLHIVDVIKRTWQQ